MLVCVKRMSSFFAGLKMASPDMQEAAHTFYANQHLYDLRVISTLGLSKKDIHTLASVEGVEAVMPSRTVDVMATLTSLPITKIIGKITLEIKNDVFIKKPCIPNEIPSENFVTTSKSILKSCH